MSNETKSRNRSKSDGKNSKKGRKQSPPSCAPENIPLTEAPETRAGVPVQETAYKPTPKIHADIPKHGASADVSLAGEKVTNDEGRLVSSKEADSEYGKPLEHDPNFRGPIDKRGCTDIICCFIFIIFILGLIAIAVFAYTTGDPKLLLYPTDSNNDLCGHGKYADKRYLYFYDLFSCVKGGPGIFVHGCPTTQVCVKECPDQFEVLYVPGSLTRCKYCSIAPGGDCGEHIRKHHCPAFLLKSTPILNRCVPSPVKLGINMSTLYDHRGNAMNKSGDLQDRFDKSHAVIRQFLMLKEFTDKVVSDVVVTWWMIAIGYVAASVLSFIWILLMRWIARPIIYITMFLFIGIFAFGVVWCFLKFAKTRNTDLEFRIYLVVTSFSFSHAKFWLGFGIISSILFVIVCIVMIFLRKRIQLAVCLISEGSKAVGTMMLTLLWPIVPFLMQLGVIALWLSVAVFLSSVGRGKKPDFMNSNVTHASNNLFQKLDCNVLNSTFGEFCGYLKYGTDKYTFYLQIYILFMFFWLLNFVVALGQMTLAGAFASYYWAMEKPRDIPSCSLGAAFYRCIRYHFGTLAFGSLIIAIVKIIRVMLEYLDHKLKNSENKCAKFCLKCCMCCFWCLEKFLQFLNKNAYIMTAIYGKNFCTSARQAFLLIMRNVVRVVVIDRVTDFLLLIGKLVVLGVISCVAFLFFDRRIPGIDTYTPNLHFYIIPVIMIAIGTYMIASCFFSVYATAVDTLFLCVLEDLERNDGSPEKPYYMNKSLMKVLNKKQAAAPPSSTS